MSKSTPKMLKLASYTKGVPYLRDRKDQNGKELFKTLIGNALSNKDGLTAWFAEKDKLVALWAQWFGPMVGDAIFTGNGQLTPVIKGYLNNDVNEVAYALKYGESSLDVAWFKNIWAPNAPTTPTPPTTTTPPSTSDDQYAAVGMPGIKVNSSPDGLARFAGFLPKVGDLGAEAYAGSLLWGSLAGPLARNMMSQLTVLGKNWWNKVGAKSDVAKDLATDVETETQATVTAEGDPGSASNLNEGLGTAETPVVQSDGTKLVPENPTTTQSVAKASSKDKGKMIAEGAEAEGGEAEIAAPFLEGVEFAPGLVGLVGMAFFAYLPIYLRGKRKHINMRLEVVNSSSQPVSWDYAMLKGGTPLQAPSDTVIAESQPLVIASDGFKSDTPTSHAADFEFGNDAKGSNPLELVMNLTVGAKALVAAISIDKDGTCRSWVGPRTGTDTDGSIMQRCQISTSPTTKAQAGDILLSCNVGPDARAGAPKDPNASSIVMYSALIHLE